MSDLIDRQAAIDCVNRAVTQEAARWAIKELPSAQPDVPDRNVGDMISRQDVLALAKDVILINGAKHRCIDATQIHELPSAQRTGRWIGRELGYCSCCGYEGCASDIWSGCKKDHMFCPNCGAQMEVGE